MTRAQFSLSACFLFLACLIAILAGSVSCSKQPQAPAKATETATPSAIKVEVRAPDAVVITTPKAEFQVLPSGVILATLLQGAQRLTLDDPSAAPVQDVKLADGKPLTFTSDFSQVKVSEATGKLGRGKHVEIPGHAADGSNLQQTEIVEVYDDFPQIALESVAYKNSGNVDLHIDQVVTQQHRFNNHEPKGEPYDMWSFHGSSYDWGEEEIQKVTRTTSLPNLMGEMVKGGYGGGVPVVAFWTANVGEAIGHVETLPWTLAIPTKVESDGRISADVSIPVNATLAPGESYATPRSFVSVYSGDFYEPLRMWSSVLQKEGWDVPKPSNEAYNVSWCGWGYEFNVTPAQMLGTIPKLKELGIKWATLDDRWFDTYGDWNPRADTFPGDSIKKMVDGYHQQGMLAQLWWLPIAVEDGEGKYESHKYAIAQVVKDHPDWLILNKDGSHARITRNLAALDPSLPEVQAYYKRLTEKFIRDWGFDGSKLDNIYSVPACYNPAHHHKSPQESVRAMGEVYKTIFETTRSIKPESVTQSCPCGTPPSLAWLAFMDQAVTADPVGAVQVRRRIKMYKALLGPQAAVYGDHVELSAMTRVGANNWSEHGDDFASTLGVGGVPGTKFVWPDPGPKYKPVNLTPEKEEHWKKWIALYNEKMLSKGEFRDLYVYGYDIPEAYAIEKDGKMYYAFFSDTKPFSGELELRGLKPGTHHVVDYVDGKDFGDVQADADGAAKLKAEIKDHLLLEVSSK